MVDISTIQDMGRQVAERFKPAQVVLFGSYAYGTPSEDSDIDLLVVMPREGDEPHLAANIRLALPSQYPIDVLVHSQRRLRERIQQKDGFLSEIMTKGRVLYSVGSRRIVGTQPTH